MKNRFVREDAKHYFLPFILGNDARSHLLSLKIFHKYGIISFVCKKKRGLADFLDYSSSFVRLCDTESSRLIAEQLVSLAEQSPTSLPLLIADCEEFDLAVEEQRKILEKRFIILSGKDLFTDSPLTDIYR